MKEKTNIQPLIDLMATLRHPEKGCPWDLQQSHESLVSMTFEELAELADAIAQGDMQNLCEELGDVLFHLVFYARIAEENGDFTLQTVIDEVVKKMTRRHPHIFLGKVYADANEQKADWERIKITEQKGKKKAYPMLDAASSKGQKLDALPTVLQSVVMQKNLAKLGFDWFEAHDVFAKIQEEIDELKAELPQVNNIDNITEEYGDVLFAVLNLGRKLEIDPDMALRQANHKFYTRCEAMIDLAGSVANFATLPMADKASLWSAVKLQSDSGGTGS